LEDFPTICNKRASDSANENNSKRPKIEGNGDAKIMKDGTNEQNGETVSADGNSVPNFTTIIPANHVSENSTNGDVANGHVTHASTNENCSNGHVTNGTGDMVRYPVDLELEHVLGKMPQKVIDVDILF